ncbi:DUF6578 domain-containing protein [Streptomyces sp. NPDC006385]|uniref:DUF6578 domain-containing protein n=1 Tax=Streptomyces sp. NPDC006385 TaxID=3156761 RepID=UPI0033B67308
MGLWHVFYADWQMECCGTPFSLGDEVSRPLLLGAADDMLGGGRHAQLTEIAGPVEDVRGDAGAVRVVRVVRDETGLTAETHGHPDLPEPRGRVRAIQILPQGFAETPPGSGTPEPVPRERSLRSSSTCPTWFPDAAAGVIVAPEVPDTDSRLSYAVREPRGIPRERTTAGVETTGLPPAALAALPETLSTAAMP